MFAAPQNERLKKLKNREGEGNVLAIVALCFVPPANASIDGGNETYQEEELQPLVLRAENQRLRQQLADQQPTRHLLQNAAFCTDTLSCLATDVTTAISALKDKIEVWGLLVCIHTRLYAGCREAVSTSCEVA